MIYAKRSLRLYLSNRSYVTATPAGILAIMLALSILISVVIGMVSGFPLSPDIQDGMRENNAGAVYSIPGFLISLGALAVNRNFAMALAFGSTRRHFWLGTTMGFGITAAITAAAAVVMLAIEKATNHWFFGVHAFDVAALGNGDYLLTFAAVFVLALVSMAVGALFGTVYRAFGTRGVVVSALGTGGLVIIAVLLAVANREALAPIVGSFGDWTGVVVTGLISTVALVGSYAANRVARL
jgi:hypothetical protein